MTCLALAGCGGGGDDGEGGSSEGSPEEQVRTVATDFFDAVNDADTDGDADAVRACGLLEDGARAERDKLLKDTFVKGGCPDGWNVTRKSYGSGPVQVENVDVDASSATVSGRGVQGNAVTLKLVDTGDGWRITDGF